MLESGIVPGGNQTLIADSIPEPATWAMMVLSFAGLGLAAFHRAGKREAATA